MVLIKHNYLKSDIFFNPIFIPGFSGSGSRVQGPGSESGSGSGSRVRVQVLEIVLRHEALTIYRISYLNTNLNRNA